MIEVVAALIERSGRVLLCKRPMGKAQGGRWEFPGGKIEPGERSEAALARECREELDLEVEVGAALADVAQEYPGRVVHLTLYRCRILRGEPRRLEHSDMRWVAPEELRGYELCAADARLVERMEEGAARG